LSPRKVVVVTGANGQLGSALVHRYLELGLTVVALDINQLSNQEQHENLFHYYADVEKLDATKTLFRKIVSHHGNIDILVNNAGVAYFTHFKNRTETEMDNMYEVNLKGSVNCILSLVESRKSSDTSCSIVNIASLYGIVSPDFRIYNEQDRRSPEMYGATKAGLIQITKYFAVALADNSIRVNAVSPGGIFNDSNPQSNSFVKNYSLRTPLKRMAKVNEIVGPVVFLSLNESSYITGHNLVVDGGYSAL
jgi:NAD(P)-dependent dehydrogenase (short-subunit alcohol dehydrogenase family)